MSQRSAISGMLLVLSWPEVRDRLVCDLRSHVQVRRHRAVGRQQQPQTGPETVLCLRLPRPNDQFWARFIDHLVF